MSGGDQLLWKTEFSKQCQATAERNRAQQIPISYEMLASEENYSGRDQQLEMDIAVYAQIISVAKKV